MASREVATNLANTRQRIALKVRELRSARRLSQAELASKLGLSQSRLSEIESGQGSFTAEQLLQLLRLFNVDVSAFGGESDPGSSDLQNALARFGARHLRHRPDAPLAHEYRTPADALRAVLLNPTSERFVTALAPVLVWSVDAIALTKVQSELAQAGVPTRLGWLVDNTREAIPDQLLDDLRPLWNQRLLRAHVILTAFNDRLQHLAGASSAPDPFDQGIRSTKSFERALATASEISKRWNVVSTLVVDDFAEALRAARESD
jgi:HTH-type transcriptional regulator/antitoxin HipB